ncbi:hypothetical protein CR513_54954 [Mucuna pruriens]|uniref:Uncharacterized protein n=1 Tax=Mucuna pruriens TaxID=157652 RepID=A0A371EJS1_MUCPR|nr:hypothetical protein CR513_54954 [Mucuna pruriens]
MKLNLTCPLRKRENIVSHPFQQLLMWQ